MRPTLDQLMSYLGGWIVCGYCDEIDGEKYEGGPYNLVGVLTAAPGGTLEHRVFLDSWLGGQPDSGGFEFDIGISRLRYIRIVSTPAHALVGPDERCGLAQSARIAHLAGMRSVLVEGQDRDNRGTAPEMTKG